MTDLNFKISEPVYSQKAIKNNINNMPDINSLDCMVDLIVYCLQPISDKLGKPMTITSGFSNSEVNSLVGCVSTSQHTKGQAVDFTVSGYTPAQLVKLIQGYDIEFDQLINKYDSWVHISYVKGNNRSDILKY